MTLKQLQARNNALMQECETLRYMLAESRAARKAQRSKRLRINRINKGEQLCLV